MMSLGDFIAELRDYDIRTVVIDEILQFMSSRKWVQLWKRRASEETWISVVVRECGSEQTEARRR